MARSESRAIPTPQLEIYKLNELTDSLKGKIRLWGKGAYLSSGLY
jgi:hypothetical protein